ncbi:MULTISPECIES: hypothetical protein [Streptomyces]|uniref:EXLDI protein n=1 Tax=Streptomyces dengpaensis TaxID=2049881 RepID=A0ABN5I9R2_9ACTN|nr:MULTISPECIES: hypothetical protein [Streptomyces]AVH59944.1 hypothetical protein C4B68_33885 [Streptomyces dengpaensis]PIB09579.1 hypothetical protein B1C81_10560 [Streptomyces sp. HG99]
MTDRTPLTEQQLDSYAELAITAEHDGIQVDPAVVTRLVDEVRRLQFQCRYLIGQLAKRDAASGRGDRAVREFLTADPGPTVQPTGYVVSCLPAGHDDRWTFTVQVQHAGGDKFVVRHGLRHYGVDGAWSYEPGFDEDDDSAEVEWADAHRFDHDTALRLARELAPRLTYRGRTVADVLAEGAQR